MISFGDRWDKINLDLRLDPHLSPAQSTNPKRYAKQ
jgi:hypothetical protein